MRPSVVWRNADVLLSDPMEFNAPMWVDLFGMQWMGTSNYEYYGSMCPELLELLHGGDTQRAMEEYWRIQPPATHARRP